jgi:hypothetical protein
MISPFRNISFSAHGAIETIAAPAIMAAPFVLGFSVAAGTIAIVIGAVLLGLALSTISTSSERRPVRLSSHAAFDYAIAVIAVVAGIAAAIGGHSPVETFFFVGLGVALLALTANTRFSAPRDA